MRALAGILAALLTTTAAAAAPHLDLPAGTLGSAVTALGTQAGVSIAIADGGLWGLAVPAVRGPVSVPAALAQMTRGTPVRIIAIDAVTWRIERPRAAVPTTFTRAAPQFDDEPIIVTAMKRGLRFVSYAGKAERIDGNDLSFGGVQGTDGILAQLASVSSTHLGNGRNKLFIRGIADSSFSGPTQATVGQYLGDVRLTYNAPDPDLRLYDVASVEVLEGPQAALYGAGSLGGIVRIVRNPPRLDEAEGLLTTSVAATQHGDPSGEVSGTVNLPIVAGRVALRVVGYGVDEGGYIDDVERHKKDINRTRTAGGRAALRFRNGDGWTVDIGATIQAIDGDDSQYADRSQPPLTRSSAIAQGFHADFALGDLVVAKDWGEVQLLSSTGIAKQSLDERFDAGPDTFVGRLAFASSSGVVSPVSSVVPETGEARVFTQANRTWLISSETRLWRPLSDGYGWLVGGSVLHNHARLRRTLGPDDAPLPVTGVINGIDEATLFAEASYQPLPHLTLSGGGRLSTSKLSGDGEDIVPAFSPLVTLARARTTANRRDTRVLPTMSVTAEVLPEVTLFSRYSQGFRPGGLSVDSDFVRRFRSDRVTTLETGVRSGLPDRGVFDLAVTVALIRWTDIQADFVDGNGLPTTANIGNGRISSLSATAGWRPLTGLSLDAALVLNDSRVTDPRPAALSGEPITRIPNVSRFTARGGIDYRRELTDAVDLRIGASARYTGRSRLGVGPVLGQSQGNYLDTSLTARVGRPSLGVTLALTNLADSIGNRFALGTPYQALQAGQITPLRPRTLRIGIDASF